ncbi:MAG: hypothetical protein QM699_13805 [Amaricoccus sp.]
MSTIIDRITATAITQNLVRHADRGDDRVDREDQVDERDLHHHRGEAAHDPSAAVAFVALKRLVDLHRRLVDQEQPARGEDQVLAAHVVAEGMEQRLGQADDPADEHEQHQPRHQRQRHAGVARRRLPLLRQLADEHRDDHQIVDAEHDLQHGQGQEARQGIKHGVVPLVRRAPARGVMAPAAPPRRVIVPGGPAGQGRAASGQADGAAIVRRT